MALRRRIPCVLAFALVAFTGLVPSWVGAPSASARPATPATASAATAPSPDVEAQFVSRINELRASKGLPTLPVSGALTGVARAWTEQMVAAGQISHNPDLASQVGGAWTKLGENVGVGYDVSGLMQAFIDSPAHYANLVDPSWTHVSVGVTLAGNGRIYTTHNFMALGESTPPAPPAAAPPASPPPPPTPPVTTTTAAPPPPPPPPPPVPHPTEDRVAAVLDPLRSLEQG